MHEHPCRTTFPIGTSDSDSDKVFADLGDHLVVGDTDMEVFLRGLLLIQTRLAYLWSCDDGRHIGVDHKVVFLDLIASVSDDNFYIAVMESCGELIIDIIDGYEVGISELVEEHSQPRHTCTTCSDKDDISHERNYRL